MTMNFWLPSSVRWAWIAIYLAVLIVHLQHVCVMAGRHRLWHGVHVVMAAAMIVMFMPAGPHPLTNRTGIMIFTIAALTLSGALLGEVGLRAEPGRLWLVNILDLAAMAYMFAMGSIRPVWLTVALTGWFIAQTFGWSSGALCAVLAQRGLGGPGHALTPAPSLAPTTNTPDDDPAVAHAAAVPHAASATGLSPTATGARGRKTGTEASPTGHPAGVGPGVLSHAATGDLSIRLTLAAMSLGMAYMLLAMQFGMNTMSGMSVK